MTEEQTAVLRALRAEGCVVTIFTRDELRNLVPSEKAYLQNMLVVEGRKFLDFAVRVKGLPK